MEDLDLVSASLHLLSVILAQSDLPISEQSLETEHGALLPSNLVAVRLQWNSLYVPMHKEGAREM